MYVIDRIKTQSLSKLEKDIRKNQQVTILDFKKVVQEINK